MKPSWELLDEGTRLYRAEYSVGYGGRASSYAFGLESLGSSTQPALALISPPAGWAGVELFDQLKELGDVQLLVAPNGLHRLGLPEATRRYPHATVFAPAPWLARVRKVVPGARPLRQAASLLPQHVELTELPHMKRAEAFMRLRTERGTAWYLNDVVTNIQALPEGLVGFLFDAMGFREGLALNTTNCRFVTRAIQPDWRDWLSSELRNEPPALFLPGHGPPITGDPRRLQELVSRTGS